MAWRVQSPDGDDLAFGARRPVGSGLGGVRGSRRTVTRARPRTGQSMERRHEVRTPTDEEPHLRTVPQRSFSGGSNASCGLRAAFLGTSRKLKNGTSAGSTESADSGTK